MTETRIADLIVPDVWRPYMMQLTTRLDLFIQSGVAVDINDALEDFGLTVHMPFLNDLNGDDNVSSDTTDIDVASIGSGQDVAVKLMRDKAFGATDLSAEISGADPVGAIAARFGKYWAGRRQVALLAAMKGQFAQTVAGDNVSDISGLQGSAAVFGAESFIDATHQLGDAAAALRAIAIHSDTEKVMKKLDLIDFIKPSDGGEPIPYYQGRRVIVDDGMPNPANGNPSGIYDSYIFGPGAVGYASRARRNAVEVGRDPLKNGGREYIVSREQWVMHTRGIKWLGTVQVGQTPSNVELGTAGNWSKVYETKNIRAVRFRHRLVAAT